jgi:enoyl-CoA hydratase/carnithine racemase
MITSMRQSTLETLGLGTVLEIFQRGRLPADTGDLVDHVFENSGSRGSLVISGANGIVGAGKTMQLGARLRPYDVPIVALDFPGVPDGIGMQYSGLLRAFGPEHANKIMETVVRLTYDGAHLPPRLSEFKPRFLLEAIPEILHIKKSHYEMFRSAFPSIEIRSVTSGFPSSQLGVGIAHPAFPHEINKVYEIVEPAPSAITQLLWSLGLIPIPVGDNWSFVLDVLFCGLTLAGLRYHRARNMPFWKADKYIRKLLGPNPFRAHDAIGAAGANFLTWTCLHHLAAHYGDLFEPTPELIEHKDSGQNWYPLNHLRPVVNWTVTSDEENEFNTWILGAMCQMTSLLLHEKRSHLSHINAIGELCAQFRRGTLAVLRDLGSEAVIRTVETYQKLHPSSAEGCWYPETYEEMESADWQQLYVNAEHDGNVGVITIGRESYNSDVDGELNRAIDWLKGQGIDRVIVTGDFHLSSQLVGADVSEFFPALSDTDAGFRISRDWSRTARRLNDEFQISVGFVHGKRCLGGCLELLLHCHSVISVDDATLGLPEATLPVVPGMEACHWPFRKASKEDWPRLVRLLLEGRPVRAHEAVSWLIDHAGPLDDALQKAWMLVSDGDHGLTSRDLQEGSLEGIPTAIRGVSPSGDAAIEAARRAIVETIVNSCAATLSEALDIQAKHSAAFMTRSHCRKGMIGATYAKAMTV